jgi:hypothetical protein
MPRPSQLDDDDDEAAAAAGRSAASKAKKSSKQRMKEAYEQASQQQMLRVDECIKFNKEHKRGKVRTRGDIYCVTGVRCFHAGVVDCTCSAR